ncbi:MAG: quinate 5-dehydrogenase [Anaerolineae bacterium]
MKVAVSVSLGSKVRDAEAEIELLGQKLLLRREGWNGSVEQVTQRFKELDGQVDAFGVGGIDLWVYSASKKYPLNSAHKLIRYVDKTPVVDGSGLKHTLERQTAGVVTSITDKRKVLIVSALDRMGMTQSFFEDGFDVLCGDGAFALGIPLKIRTLKGLGRLANMLLPIVSRLPIHMIYPTGEAQNVIVPKYADWYKWADIIAGDCLYIKKHMPDDLAGKIIVTNTTTAADREAFRRRGVETVITTTPIINGRSFGTNLFEAGLTAVAGRGRPLLQTELDGYIRELGLRPTVVDD